MNIQMAGIRNIKDALMCVECGVNIIGLLVGQAHKPQLMHFSGSTYAFILLPPSEFFYYYIHQKHSSFAKSLSSQITFRVKLLPHK